MVTYLSRYRSATRPAVEGRSRGTLGALSHLASHLGLGERFRAMSAIRFADASDAKTILSFIQALADYEREPHAVETSEATLTSQLSMPSPPFECLLAEENGTAQGFALFFHTYSTWRGRRGIWLEDLFVLPDRRRQGVGRALLQRVASVAVERGCARFEWAVLDWNTPAIDFYRSLGARLLVEWTTCRVDGTVLRALAAG